MLKLIVFLLVFCLTANSVSIASDGLLTDSQQSDFSSIMIQADKNRMAGRYDQAIEEYSRVIPKAPRNFLAHKWRGICYIRREKDREALLDLERWGALRPQDSYCSMYKGLVLARLGKYVEALLDLDAAINERSDRPLAYIERSVVRMELGQFKGSRADAFEHLNIVPNSPFSFELCSISSALSAMPDDAVFYLGQYAYNKLHKSPELHRREEFEKENSKSEAHLTGISVMTYSQGQHLLANLNNKPNALSADQRIFARGVLYFYSRQFELAAVEISRCASARTRIQPLLIAFYSHIFGNHLAEALTELRILTKLFPLNADVLDAMDIYYYETERRQAGIVEISNLVALNPRSVAALTSLSKIYRDLNDFSEAEKYGDAALHLSPKDEKLLLMKSQLLINLGNDSEALMVLNAVLSLNHNSGPAYMSRASIFTHQEKWTQAVDALSQSIKLKYDYVKALKARSVCYRILKKTELANKDLAIAEEIDPILWQPHLLTH